MRSFVFATAAVAFAAGIAAPALAQDGPFTGPRVGAIIGYDRIQPGSSEDSDIRNDDQSADGLLYGVDAGYDIAFNRAVVGIEGEVTGSTGKVENRPVDPNFFGYGRVKAGRDLYLGGRIGFLATPKTLVYGKAGYTNARLDLDRNDGTTNYDRHFNLDGYRVGAGVEQQLSPKTYIKAEYRYSNYGSARLEYPNGANTDNFSVDTDRHQIAVGAGFRF